MIHVLQTAQLVGYVAVEWRIGDVTGWAVPFTSRQQRLVEGGLANRSETALRNDVRQTCGWWSIDVDDNIVSTTADGADQRRE